MIFIKDLIGLPIISSIDRKLLGYVKNILFKDFIDEVYGLIIDERLLLNSFGIIPNNEILSINKQIFVKSDKSIRDISKVIVKNKKLKVVNDLMNTKIYDCKNNYIGILYDLVLNERTKKIEFIEISKGFSSDLLKGLRLVGTDFIEIKNDEISIKNYATFFIRGGIKNIINLNRRE